MRMFPGIMLDGGWPFRQGTRSESAFRALRKRPPTVFPGRNSLFSDRTDFSADTGADEQENAEKDKQGKIRPREQGTR